MNHRIICIYFYISSNISLNKCTDIAVCLHRFHHFQSGESHQTKSVKPKNLYAPKMRYSPHFPETLRMGRFDKVHVTCVTSKQKHTHPPLEHFSLKSQGQDKNVTTYNSVQSKSISKGKRETPSLPFQRVWCQFNLPKKLSCNGLKFHLNHPHTFPT